MVSFNDLPADVKQAVSEMGTIQRTLAGIGVPPLGVEHRPAHAVARLLADAEDRDYRDAYLAVLASGSSEARARSIAAEASAHLAERRVARVGSGDDD